MPVWFNTSCYLSVSDKWARAKGSRRVMAHSVLPWKISGENLDNNYIPNELFFIGLHGCHGLDIVTGYKLQKGEKIERESKRKMENK